MRIAQVVAYMSDDGAFGGPVRVAQAQAAELARQGHEVTIFAGYPGSEARCLNTNGYTTHLFPARRVAPGRSFFTLRASALTREILANARDFDVFHVHLGRDLVTLPAAEAVASMGIPYVLQPHGMLGRSRNPLAPLIDRVLTRRLLKRAFRVLVLTGDEETNIRRIAEDAMVESLGNGIDPSAIPDYDSRDISVLFLARLHKRKRPLAFVAMAERLHQQFPTASYVLAGPDEGELATVKRAVAKAGLNDVVTVLGAVDPTETDRLFRASRVYVLPSINEVFPMTVLEALRQGTPTVVTSSLGISEDCLRYSAALVTDGSVEELTASVGAILENADLAEQLRRGGADYLEAELGISKIVSALHMIYSSAGASA